MPKDTGIEIRIRAVRTGSLLKSFDGDPTKGITIGTMNPIIYLPRGTKRIPQDLIGWVNRFSVPSSSGRWYVLAQHKKNRHWACSCPGYTRRVERDCKHLRNLGIPGAERAVELILQCVDGSFTIYSDGVERTLPSIPDDKTRKLIDRIAERSAKLAGKIVQPGTIVKPIAGSSTEPKQATPSARRIVLNEDV